MLSALEQLKLNKALYKILLLLLLYIMKIITRMVALLTHIDALLSCDIIYFASGDF